MTNAICPVSGRALVELGPASSQQVSNPRATLSVAQDDARLAKLPAPLREKGRLILAEPDEDKRADLAESLAEEDPIGALDFLLTLLDTDPSADVRENIVDELEEVDDPRVDPALARRVLVDADLDIALASLEPVARERASPADAAARTAAGRRTKERPRDAVRRLVAEQERWTTIVRGGLLPTFFQTPPALFSVKPAGQPIRVLAFGDFGDGSEAQKRRGRGDAAIPRAAAFDFAITLGDNFYPRGMESPTDARWADLVERSLRSAEHPVLRIVRQSRLEPARQPRGGDPVLRSAARAGGCRRRITRSRPDRCSSSPSIRTSSPRRSSMARHRSWRESRATWKVVYGHHPIYSEGQHEDNNEKIAAAAAGAEGSRGRLLRRARSRHAAPQTRGAAALLRRRQRRQAADDRTRARARCSRREPVGSP